MGRQPGMGPQGMQPGLTPQLQSVAIEDIIQTDVVTAEPDTPAPTVASMMENEAVGSVIVADGEEPVGIITDRMIALLFQKQDDAFEQTAEDVMTEDLVFGTTMMTVFEVLEEMGKENIRRFPIVDEDGSLEGIVTLDDLLVFLGKKIQSATEIIQSQSPRL
jgi:CBS domain-containing protein